MFKHQKSILTAHNRGCSPVGSWNALLQMVRIEWPINLYFQQKLKFSFKHPESTPTAHIRRYSIAVGWNALLQMVGIERPTVTYAIPENNFSLITKQTIKKHLNKQSSTIQ